MTKRDLINLLEKSNIPDCMDIHLIDHTIVGDRRKFLYGHLRESKIERGTGHVLSDKEYKESPKKDVVTLYTLS